MLESVHTFKPANLLVGQTGYPVIIEQDNGDGSFQGHLDLGNITPNQKLAALTGLKFCAAKHMIGL